MSTSMLTAILLVEKKSKDKNTKGKCMNIVKHDEEFFECIKFLAPFLMIVNFMFTHNLDGYFFIIIGILIFTEFRQAIRSS